MLPYVQLVPAYAQLLEHQLYFCFNCSSVTILPRSINSTAFYFPNQPSIWFGYTYRNYFFFLQKHYLEKVSVMQTLRLHLQLHFLKRGINNKTKKMEITNRKMHQTEFSPFVEINSAHSVVYLIAPRAGWSQQGLWFCRLVRRQCLRTPWFNRVQHFQHHDQKVLQKPLQEHLFSQDKLKQLWRKTIVDWFLHCAKWQLLLNQEGQLQGVMATGKK